MSPTIFIDGEHGTTGLQIRTRLEKRKDIDLISLAVGDRRNVGLRRQMLNEADLVILCLPDEAARESVSMIENPIVKVIDASTAHRVAEDWVYGMPEYDINQKDLIAEAKRVSNPGCYAIASIGLLHPLTSTGLLPSDFPITINAISGYSGGGKTMIAEFENPEGESYTEVPFRVYGMELEHKHVPEIIKWSGLSGRPLFVPSVGRYHKGMIVQVPLQLWALPKKPTVAEVQKTLETHYEGCHFVTVESAGDVGKVSGLTPEKMNDTNELRLYVFGNDKRDQAILVGQLDNLGKGASGQAVQNMNIMLGLPEETGLH
ncbi:MAG: N-acetyl-gamma-glutamyl-phosphate reductase [Rickettsiales bacterium]|nr:N-acetyl-gamma-glutamyl-phosphate reductase [Rickettsiales bacterium]